MKFKVACLQMNIAFGNPTVNYQSVESFIHEACQAQDPPDIIVLPEMWTTGYDLTNLNHLADKNGQLTIDFLKKIALKYQVHIVGGSVATQANEKMFNTMIVIDKEGNHVQNYSKLHLFKLMDEHLHLASGADKGMFTIDDETCAGVICYDIRFPEWIRGHVLEGAKAVFVVAEWPTPRLDHWRALLIARAIENQCYIIACNCVGSDPNNEFAGHSIIIDPWGKVLAEGGDEKEIIQAEIDLAEVDKIRDIIPVFSDRRPEYY
ncbi:carbon-nitrogen family hydrolase [Cytobacillus purgationiresistens]|uniref:Amidohydrolase n=1 Tax=Cytobacillus purgationiresistens TaxID=863449 RepID=A0ABU0AIH1_9BACI|nr:carbon-nitrogen family hydrolase [Cytobacillus purgationiresistens]MDQ0270694.1 putative amidohydrolase [Cytobacillus purgationiresistens]